MALENLPTETVSSCLLHPRSTGVPDPEAVDGLGLPPAYGVLACPRCQLRWLSPRPTAEGYRELYRFEAYFADDVEGVEPYRRVAERRRWGFRHRLARLERLCGRSRLRILDVGAATGEFVAEAVGRGHRGEGFEPSADARREARDRHGLELSGGRLEDLPGPYDAIHLNHVLEHLPDPRASLVTLRERLTGDGVLAVEVPQQFGHDAEWLLRRVGRSRHGRFGVHSLHHTYFFTPPTLLTLLTVTGFDVVGLRTFHWGITPPRPPFLRNLVLGAFLWLSDKIHRGGPVIEALARPRVAP